MISIYIGRAKRHNGRVYWVSQSINREFSTPELVSKENNAHYSGCTGDTLRESEHFGKWACNGKFRNGGEAYVPLSLAIEDIEKIENLSDHWWTELKEWMIAWSKKAIELYGDEAYMVLGP